MFEVSESLWINSSTLRFYTVFDYIEYSIVCVGCILAIYSLDMIHFWDKQ